MSSPITIAIHKAKAVESVIASHPRFELLWLPTYCPRANPIERVARRCARQVHTESSTETLRDLVQDVERHMEENGPRQYWLSRLYDAPEVTAAVEHIAAEAQVKIAA